MRLDDGIVGTVSWFGERLISQEDEDMKALHTCALIIPMPLVLRLVLQLSTVALTYQCS